MKLETFFEKFDRFADAPDAMSKMRELVLRLATAGLLTEPSEDEKQSCFDTLADDLGRRLIELCNRRVWVERAAQWQDAYDKHGTGSTFVRARIIGDDIYEPAAPVPDVTPSPDRNQFLREVTAEVEAAAKGIGAVLE
jgi:hypothetical protein